MEAYMPYIWLFTAVVLGILELSTAQLVSVWFVIAAVITAIFAATFLSGSIWLQVTVFLVLSAICLVLTRPFVKRLKNYSKTKTNSDKNIGKIGKVITAIDWQASTGQVEVEGARWSAKSTHNINIPAGTSVKVEDIQGVKLVVTPVSSFEEKGV